MSEIRVDNIIGETGVDAVRFTKGVNVTGIVTASSFSGSVAASQLTGALPAISGANLTGISAGITMTDQWRVTANFHHGAGTATITSNWEQNDTYYTTLSGGSMTESSGIFTFPTTGILYIKVQGYLYKNSFVGSATITIDTTTNNSSYSGTGNTYFSHVTGTDGTQYSHTINTMMFDVTDASQCKCAFRAVGSAGQWDSSHVEFIRLGDT